MHRTCIRCLCVCLRGGFPVDVNFPRMTDGCLRVTDTNTHDCMRPLSPLVADACGHQDSSPHAGLAPVIIASLRLHRIQSRLRMPRELEVELTCVSEELGD